MTAEFGLELHRAVQKGQVKTNFRGGFVTPPTPGRLEFLHTVGVFETEESTIREVITKPN